MDGIHLTLGGSVSQPIAGQLYRPTGPYGMEIQLIQNSSISYRCTIKQVQIL